MRELDFTCLARIEFEKVEVILPSQMIFLFVTVLAFFVLESNCLHSLPHRARGGIAYQQYLQSQLKQNLKKITQAYFVQPLDHFDPSNPSTFGQRYFIDDSNWNNSTGPVFLNIGGIHLKKVFL